ncbi:hypothetical protein FD755_003631, partial [Muntiacus reevesi]
RKVSYFSPYSPGFSSFREHRSRADSEGELAGSKKRPGTGAGLRPTSLTPGLSPPHLPPGIRVDPTDTTAGSAPGGSARRRQAGRGRKAWLGRAGRGQAGKGAVSRQVTPTTSTLHKTSRLCSALSRESALAVSRPHPGFRGGPLKDATRSAVLGWVIARVSGRESPHSRGGRRRAVGLESLRGAILMTGLVLCEPTELYNILNQVTKLSRLTEPNYLCLLDVRSKREYDESHVITALLVKKRAGKYLIPESVDLECVEYCVIYDNSTISLELMLKDESSDDDSADDGKHRIVLGAAVECGRTLTHLTRHPILILRGGYEHFSAMYHFFRTQKIIWMPQELDAFQPYPIEIIPGRIYLGNFKQACDPKIQKDLKINAHVNISMETGPFFVGDADRLLHIQIEDSLEASITPFLRLLCHFIDIHLELNSVILVFSTLGISRSCAAILAYLMHRNGQTLKRSWAYLKKCKNNMRPNRALVVQLSEWEKVVLGDIVTDIQNPPY